MILTVMNAGALLVLQGIFFTTLSKRITFMVLSVAIKIYKFDDKICNFFY
jgi:hypothetical protein